MPTVTPHFHSALRAALTVALLTALACSTSPTPSGEAGLDGGAAGSDAGLANLPYATSAGGYVTSGRWHGYAWTVALGAGSSISPQDFSALAAGANLCAKGTVGAAADWSGSATLGFNLNQASAANSPANAYTPSGPGVRFKLSNPSKAPLRLRLQDAADPKNGWCAVLTSESGFVAWSSFNTQCWATSGGRAYALEPISAIAVTVPGDDDTAVPFEVCIESLEEASGDTPGCTTSAACGDKEVCVIDKDGKGTCILGSNQPCDATNGVCIKSMGFHFVNSVLEGFCETSSDCGVDGHWVGICVDADGAKRRCVPICQYAQDPEKVGCATHPRLGLRTDCSRVNARAYLAAGQAFACAGVGNLTSMSCTKVAPESDVTPAFEWTLQCYEAGKCQGCMRGYSFSDPAATQTNSEFFDSVGTTGTKWTYTTGTPGIGSTCSTDCDCGHCNYCEKSGGKGTCRYGGEGPYGCYRGCD